MSDNFLKQLELLNSRISQNLDGYLKSYTGFNQFSEVYSYSVLPAGKLFRPILACLSYCDAKNIQIYDLDLNKIESISFYSSFLELHHVYTLMHDDLPAMDNDQIRRGREASHIKFNEWKALLAGDGLSILSFRLLSNIQHPKALELLKIATWATGPKGLIYGQYLDLSQEINLTFEHVLETHLLKTARLIQLSLLGGQILGSGERNRESKNRWKLGKSLGIIFQLLDDLDDYFELINQKNSEQTHEGQINPWIKYPKKCSEQLQKEIKSLKNNSKDLNYCKQYINYFLEKSVNQNINHIKKNNSDSLGDLMPTLSLLNL